MTATAMSLLIGGIALYLGFLAFVLALMTAAKRADAAAARQAAVQGTGDDRLAHPNREEHAVRFVRLARRAHDGMRDHESDAVAPGPAGEQAGSSAHRRNMG